MMAHSQNSWNVENEEQLLNAAQKFTLPPKVRIKKAHHKKLPFETIDFSIYDSKDGGDSANVVGFRADRHRICPWAYALVKYHVLQPTNSDPHVELLTEQGSACTPESKDLFKLELKLKDTTIVVHFSYGVILISGEGYRDWANSTFQEVLDIVDVIAPTIKGLRQNASNSKSTTGVVAEAQNTPNKTSPHSQVDRTLTSTPKISDSDSVPLPDSITQELLNNTMTTPSSPHVSNTDSSKPVPDNTNSNSPKANSPSSKSKTGSPSRSPKDKFLHQAACIKEKSDIVLSRLEEAVTKVVDVIGKIETDNAKFHTEMRSEITIIKQRLNSVIDDHNALKGNVQNSNSVKNTSDVNEKALKKIQSDLSACQKGIGENASSLQAVQRGVTECSGNVNSVKTDLLGLTQTTNNLQTTIAEIKLNRLEAQLGPGAKPKQQAGGSTASKPNDPDLNRDSSPVQDRDPPEIRDDVDTVVLTDSISRNLTPAMMMPHKCQTASYGGLRPLKINVLF